MDLSILLNWIQSISQNIFAAILISLFVILVPKLKKRTIRKLFLSDDKKAYDIVCTTIEYQNTPYHGCRPVTAYGELLALAELYSTFNELGGVGKFVNLVRMSSKESFSNERLQNNLIIIGGSTYNRVSKLFSEKCNSGWKIISDDNLKEITDGNYSYTFRDNGEIFKAEKDFESNRITLDYGLITKFKNPFNIESTVIFIDGLHTYGLIGAAKAMSPSVIKKYQKIFNHFRDDSFQILVKCNVIDLEVCIDTIRYFKL
ncbi:MAG: hypothetical protein ACD_19C00364G0003 [uncultured bacterium]|nr:MAG: hypothetical protein ACD_19C00364G0003 [uncultured bacterium]